MFYKNEVYEKCRVFVRIELIYVIKVFLENIFDFKIYYVVKECRYYIYEIMFV